MSENKKLSFFIVCLLYALLCGCSATMNSVLSDAAGALDYIKANSAVTNGDNAYDRGDYQSAFEYFSEAAELGHSYGQFKRASMHMSGEGTERDMQAYVQWLAKSAEGGYPPANYLMGVGIHSNNPQDAALAIKYLEKAAEKEHVGAMHMLGLVWATGTGVETNHSEALRWFRMAKAYGLPVESQLLSEPGIASYVYELERSAPASNRSRASSRSVQNLVKNIQQGLKNLGYDPGPVDGLYGSKTRAAIEALQRDSEITPDGEATQKTLELIEKRGK